MCSLQTACDTVIEREKEDVLAEAGNCICIEVIVHALYIVTKCKNH